MPIHKLQQKWQNCKNCQLHRERTNIVFGEGNLEASIVLIGEAPGEEEDFTGRPFVGPSGRFLTRLMEVANCPRDEIFITNIIACKPPGNRDPLPDEIRACLPRVQEILRIIDPLLLILCGKVALNSLSKNEPITKVRGQICEGRIYGIEYIYPIAAMPILHPQFLRRDGDRGPDSYLRKTAHDIHAAFTIADELNYIYYQKQKPERRPPP